ncbi:MAG: DUF1700 domain-containing protein [Lachnospiraceae bacterium]|nr:DUF1700 domain-containing protein [Lachnospiraceae bacterium]
MNRTDFMNQLECLLQNISPAEREEALQYYNEYFNDAGEENEQDVIEALGNPAKVAENIKRDLYGSGYGDAVFQKDITNERAMVQYQQNKQSSNTVDNSTDKENKLSTGTIVLLVVLGVLASPVLIGLASSVLGVVVGIIASWFGLIISFGIAAVALVAVMIILAVVGIMSMFADVLVGTAMLGAGLVCGGLGILFLMLTVAMAGIATPAICRGIASLCRSIFRKKQAA